MNEGLYASLPERLLVVAFFSARRSALASQFESFEKKTPVRGYGFGIAFPHIVLSGDESPIQGRGRSHCAFACSLTVSRNS